MAAEHHSILAIQYQIFSQVARVLASHDLSIFLQEKSHGDLMIDVCILVLHEDFSLFKKI
jgi:hypothetical protein